MSRNRLILNVSLVVSACVVFMFIFCLNFSISKPDRSYAYMFIAAGICLATIGVLWMAWRMKWDVGKSFIVISIVSGLLFMVATPVFRTPDESVHLYRAVEVAMGHATTPVVEDNKAGRELPSGFVDIVPEDPHVYAYNQLWEDVKTVPMGADTPVFVNYPYTALYSPVAYLPQAVGVKIGMLINISPVITAYMGRIMNLLIFILLGFLVLRNTKYNKFLFVLMLTPMNLHISTSLSPDVLTNMLSLFLFSLVVKWWGESISKRDLAIAIVCCLMLSLCKTAYLPICGLMLLFNYGSKSKKAVTCTAVFVICAALALGWYVYSSKFMAMCYTFNSPQDQLAFVLHEPFTFLAVLFNTLSRSGVFYLQSMVGANLGYFDIPIDQWTSFLLLGLMGYLWMSDNPLSRFSTKIDRFWLCLILLGTFLLIHVSLYMQYTTYKAALIQGVQGRYLLPLVPILLLLFGNKQKSEKKYLGAYTIVLLCLVNLFALLTIFLQHI